MSTIVELFLKRLQEIVGLQTFNWCRLQQIQLDIEFLKQPLKESVDDVAAIDFLLKEFRWLIFCRGNVEFTIFLAQICFYWSHEFRLLENEWIGQNFCWIIRVTCETHSSFSWKAVHNSLAFVSILLKTLAFVLQNWFPKSIIDHNVVSNSQVISTLTKHKPTYHVYNFMFYYMMNNMSLVPSWHLEIYGDDFYLVLNATSQVAATCLELIWKYIALN